MAATSMMKEYVKRQLKYWVDNFKDDQLPRDFNAKGFARPQITLHKITLKADKIAALLHVRTPLLVTRATCSELTIKVPSWQLADKFVQEPLSLRLGDLFVDIKHVDECDDHVRRDAIARARAASMEPDPLGSIASMYQFATIIHERLELLVENIYLKLYENHALRVRVELSHFHARTTNAMWQDMRDLTDCVDRSPDGQLKTRFKFVSAKCSVYLHAHAGDATATTSSGHSSDSSQQTPPPLRLISDHAVAMRMTLFGHRTEAKPHDAWEILSRVVDFNLGTLSLDMDTTHVRQVFTLGVTLVRWMHETSETKTDEPLLPHQVERVAVTPTQKAEAVDETDTNKRDEEDSETVGHAGSTFALQITVRFTLHVLLRVRSERRGDVQLAVIAQHAALNCIQHDDTDASTEMQLTVHDLSVRRKEKVLFHAKPARDVLQLKRLPGPTKALFLKWHLHKLSCHLENEIAMVANELFHALNEIEQAATITCGTCHHKIRLDTVATHVCSAAVASHSANVSDTQASGQWDSTQIPKLRVVFTLDELELVTDSFLFRSVQDLARCPADAASSTEPVRRFVVTLKDWSVSTESKEFVGDAIFVPVLPLAFQMLECTIRGCGCVQRQQQQQKQKQRPSTMKASSNASDSLETERSCMRALPRWPDRVFAELGHFSIRATTAATKTETLLSADGASLRLSFSDGRDICQHSTPHMSCFFHVERIRCHMEHAVYQHLRRVARHLQDPLEGCRVTALTLFFAVLEIRTVELTLLQEKVSDPKGARGKVQFRHVGGVADNHQGVLSLQTTFDFRALLQSESATFEFASDLDLPKQELANSHDVHVRTKRERRRRRDETLLSQSAQRIQSVFRRFVATRRRQVGQQLRRRTREDDATLEIPGEPSTDPQASPSHRTGKPLPLFGSSEDNVAAISPMKMVAAASQLKDGVMGFVKAKQLRLETEMAELALQSKESASRFIPNYSAVKNLLSPKASSATTVATATVVIRSEESTGKDTEVRDVEAEDTDAQADDGGKESPEDSDGEALNEGEGEGQLEENELEEQEDDKAIEESDEADEKSALEQAALLPVLSATETLLASLPPIVRLLVQVEEHRLCVPMDPRATVAFLGQEIVRRFNEMFAQSGGVITHVTLQNPQGGVFAGSDTIGLVWDTTAGKHELLFAYPHAYDAGGKSVVHIDPSSPPVQSPASGSRDTKRTAACAFTRCSKLPLPLAVALLANESERSLLWRIGHNTGDDWPELALNASFLDPARDMLQVEVRWPATASTGQCVEVTNRDAFLLCLQQLGLCTSRENSKHVGKVLRDRLKMDTKNPLIRAACRASPEFQENYESEQESTEASYASLKEIVQEDFGVYTRANK